MPLLGPAFSAQPVGAVIAYAGQLAVPGAGTEPATPHALPTIEAWGWMLCNGRVLQCDDYSELYASLGGQYGAPDPGSFRIPDLRGYFLRGADPDTAVDVDGASRTPQGTGKANDVGSRQQCALQDHVHLAAPGGVPVPQAGPAAPTATSPNGPAAPPPATGAVRISAHETRPVNMSVHYLIRFTNRLHYA